jgi:hypothetical protein
MTAACITCWWHWQVDAKDTVEAAAAAAAEGAAHMAVNKAELPVAGETAAGEADGTA